MGSKQTFPIEQKLERGLDRLFTYLTKKPKNEYEMMDKHALIFEIIALVSMFVAIILRGWR